MTLSPMTPDQEATFQAWRALAMEKMPYFARILFNLRVLNAPGLGTWAVDGGYRMYIDFDAVTKKSLRWNVESVLHECSHLFAEHKESAADLGVTAANANAWNVAADLSINDDLDEAGCTTFRVDKMLPEFIGEANNLTPHHYFRVLQAKMMNRTAPNQRPNVKITLTPDRLADGYTQGATVNATATPAFIDPTDTSITVTDMSGAPVPITHVGVRGNGFTFDLLNETPTGAYEVAVTSAGQSTTATLTVAAPSISLNPDHIERGWDAPYPVQVRGTLTDFSPNPVVTVTDENGGRVRVTNTRRLAADEILFDLAEQAPDGLYEVTVHDNGQTFTAPLPIGLSHLMLSPATLPWGYSAPAVVEALVADFTLDATTTFDIRKGTVTLPNAVTATVTGASHAFLNVNVTLPPGQYTVMATTGTEQAAAVLAVASPHEGADAGEGQGDSASDSTDDSADGGDPYKGCGSGSGGKAWFGELDLSDDLDGQAPAVSDVEKETIRIGTAADIQEHVAKGRGTVPGGLIEIASKVLEPSKTPWQQILASKIRATVASKAGTYDVDTTRRNRRRHDATVRTATGSRKLVVPGYFQPVPNIEVIRDTSGSMSANDLAVVTREVQAIAKRINIRGDNLVVTDVDAAVHASKQFKNADSIREVSGRGGTDMRVGITAAQNRKNRPTVIVVITDGGTPWPTERGRVPVIACIVPQGWADPEAVAQAVPDFIRTVVVEDAQEAGR